MTKSLNKARKAAASANGRGEYNSDDEDLLTSDDDDEDAGKSKKRSSSGSPALEPPVFSQNGKRKKGGKG